MPDFITSILLEVAQEMADENTRCVAFAKSYGLGSEEGKKLSGKLHLFASAGVPWCGQEFTSRAQGASSRRESLEPSPDSLAYGEYLRSIHFSTALADSMSVDAHRDFVKTASSEEATELYTGIIAATELGLYQGRRGDIEALIAIGRMHREGVALEYILTVLDEDR